MGPNGGEDGDGGEMKCLKLLEVRGLARLALLMPLSCYASCFIEKSKTFSFQVKKCQQTGLSGRLITVRMNQTVHVSSSFLLFFFCTVG